MFHVEQVSLSMFQFPKYYDVIVVGAGHAGTEAALAAARGAEGGGARVALFDKGGVYGGRLHCSSAEN